MGFFNKLNKGLKKTRDNMSGAINSALTGKNEIDDEFYDDLEEILIMADVGVETSELIVSRLRDSVFKKNLHKAKDVTAEIQNIVADILSGGQ
ncbi:MAG: signal recognition particle receptor subunit alpha, partial [Clostridia bacterium]|nr:signal recognition particle receptor subunit alpha [Clostridia bacterium]